MILEYFGDDDFGMFGGMDLGSFWDELWEETWICFRVYRLENFQDYVHC